METRSDVPCADDAAERHRQTEAQRRPQRTFDTARTVLIAYGSETGNAQDVAEELARVVQRLHFSVTVLDLDSLHVRDLVRYTLVIFALSTTGQGEFPQNARDFWKRLLSSAIKPGVLRRLRFTSFGLGDSSYAQYNVAHRMLQGRLLQLGAHSFCERGEGNEQHPEGHSAGLREWIVLVRQHILDTFPLPQDLVPLPDDVFIPPPWTLIEAQNRDLHAHRTTNPASEVAASDVPSPALLPIKDAYSADIMSNERCTSSHHFQDVRLLELHLPAAVPYGPGAVATVYPKNFPSDVNQFIEIMGWQEVADQPISLSSDSSGGTGISTPSPLRQLVLDNLSLTIRWLLENVLDIMSIPRRSFFSSLVYFAGTATDDEIYQKDRLLELANPELIDELWDYTTRPRRTILEVMMDFTTIKIPWRHALTVLPVMRGRQFSIASCGDTARLADGRTRVQLLVAIVDPPSPIIKWRRRYGVCTRYIADLQPGQRVSVGMHPGYLDIKPKELSSPVIMIAPGTGVAPMRALVQQRLAWNRESGIRAEGKALAGDLLFFGCRSTSGDFFFKEEWAEIQATRGLQVFAAFSRDKVQPRQYVQDHIRATGQLVAQTLVQQHGKVYVCGSSGNMPKGVRQSLLDILTAHEGMSIDESEKYLDDMQKSGRYMQETW